MGTYAVLKKELQQKQLAYERLVSGFVGWLGNFRVHQDSLVTFSAGWPQAMASLQQMGDDLAALAHKVNDQAEICQEPLVKIVSLKPPG